ncbi:hypothetical protein BDN72DRAFT_771326 [Pluteus cervinus]|uniref:Uncharacterized protein n=1 Tax=Pluteus cervinus TaxID=181527 RepID=A0ACD3AM66_9AGAR|nr:hypothetical protein BDN72DRAFT_771326 [Pluteus cervinus]
MAKRNANRSSPRPNYNDPKFKKKVREACDAIRMGTVNIASAARTYGIPYTVLYRRYHGISLPAQEAHEKQQLLTKEQEEVLVEWVLFLGLVGRPICKATLRPKVVQLCGKIPSRRWVWRFLERHPILKLRRPSGLDPKRARAFNFHTVNTCFERLKKVMQEKGITWENVYNMDEKGIQLGGGRKGATCKYFYSRYEKSFYKLKDGNLELVTVIECCCADGTSLMPTFIFNGKSVNVEDIEAYPEIL